MTSLLPPGRVLSRASRLNTLPRVCINRWSRVIFNHKHEYTTSPIGFLRLPTSKLNFRSRPCRNLVTKPGKPKAHTGRVTASKRKAAVVPSDEEAGTPKKVPAKKPAAKKASTEAKTKTRKPAAKKAARKGKSKTKSKAQPKRKVLTEKQLAANKVKRVRSKKSALLKNALLDEPKRLPATVYTLLLIQSGAKGKPVGEAARDAADKLKSLSPEEMERLNHIVNENKAKNEVAYKNWVNLHTPYEIKCANHARQQMKERSKNGERIRTRSRIADERLVKQSRSAYTYFYVDRYASGDMKNMAVSEVAALIGREWKALSATEKQPYVDKAGKDLARYIEEFTTVYGQDPHMVKIAARKSRPVSKKSDIPPQS